MAARTTRDAVTTGRQDPNRFGLLLVVLVTTYLFSAFLPSNWSRVLQIAFFLVAALLALRTSYVSRRVARAVTAIVLAGSVVAIVLTEAVGGRAAGVASAWAALILLLAVVLIVRRVLMARWVSLQSIYGAISAYMIIGLMFASGYAASSKFTGSPFFANGQPGNIETFQYFSFATLTTVGYGDFTAVAAGGRAVAVMEALIGQVFLTTLVARLVSAFGNPRPSAGTAGGATPARQGRHRHPAARRRRAARTVVVRPQYPSTARRRQRPRPSPGAGSSGMTEDGG
jgi:hypothetical protein